MRLPLVPVHDRAAYFAKKGPIWWFLCAPYGQMSFTFPLRVGSRTLVWTRPHLTVSIFGVRSWTWGSLRIVSRSDWRKGRWMAPLSGQSYWQNPLFLTHPFISFRTAVRPPSGRKEGSK